MDIRIFENYLHKVVVIRMRNNWKWEGMLLRVLENSVLIDDIIKGETWIDINGIQTIYKRENGRDK